MTGSSRKVFVAVSGGVDSSVAAALLIEAGYDCSGMFMITNDEASHAQADAEQVCSHLGIKLHILDLRKEFEDVISYFCAEYKNARTPNPCVYCNKTVKFGILWDYAQQHGADYLATGQYARIIKKNTKSFIYQGNDIRKDQSYVLSMIDPSLVKKILLPMGALSKDETRDLAAKFGLHTEHKTDSQEICFIPDDDYISFLESRCPELSKEGPVIDRNGTLLGKHKGIYRYTIGQRRGLGIALKEPFYVTHLDAVSNTITLGKKEQVYSRSLIADRLNWLIDRPAGEFEALVKIRYNHKGSMATVYPGNADDASIVFCDPVSAVTPGQAAVIYIKDEDGYFLAGGGWIKEALNE